MMVYYSIFKSAGKTNRPLWSRVSGRLLWLVFTLLLWSAVDVHAQKKTVEKANEALKYLQYADAAQLYKEALDEMIAEGRSPRSMLNLKTKLAYCYRMNNRMEEAEELYAEVVQQEKAKADTYFYYGEALMSNGKYEEAKKWFKDYQVLEPGDEKVGLMLRACDLVPLIEPFFPHVEIEEYGYNSEADDNAPVAWQQGMVFSSDRNSGIKLMKEKSGWTGRDYLDLYFTEKLQDGSWTEPKQFSSKLSEVNKNTGNASFAADGTEVYFTRNDNIVNKQQTYNLQLFRAKAVGDRWKNVEKLSFCSPNYNYMHPAISPDGKWLYFTTNRKGEGGTDLWVSQRKGDDWMSPENLGPVINTSANEGFPFVSADGRLYFCSKGHPGYGGFDIFMTEKQADGTWKTPRNLGLPINSPLDDISIYIDRDLSGGMFTSSRHGGDDDIYFFKVLDSGPIDDVGITANEGLELSEHSDDPTAGETATAVSVITDPKPEEESQEQVSEVNGSPSDTIRIMITPDPEVKIPSEESADLAIETADKAPFATFLHNVATANLQDGEVYLLDGAVFDPGIWQLTPRISRRLDELVAVMRRFPVIRLELLIHTVTSGDADDNLALSQKRAEMVVTYMIREGIDPGRLTGSGNGEQFPLNHCTDGADCSKEEHAVNQRIEIKVLKGNWKF